MNDFEKLINASDLIEWIMETYPDWCVGAIRGIVDHINELPPAQPKIKCIAKITMTDEQVKEAFEKAKCEILAAQSEDWMERNKERILQAGMEGREIEFRIGGRLFAIREKAQ